MTQFNALVPLGKITIASAGATQLLSVNCGNYGGQTGVYPTIPVPGNAWRGVEIQVDPASGGNVYLLPRGKTASANPEAIMAKIGPGGSLVFPQSTMNGVGILPENFCLDTDSSATVYGYGTLG